MTPVFIKLCVFKIKKILGMMCPACGLRKLGNISIHTNNIDIVIECKACKCSYIH